MRLTVLGRRGPGRARAGPVLRLPASPTTASTCGSTPGTGTFARLQERIRVERVGAIAISHGHADHFIDIIPAFYARHYGGLGEPGLPVLLARGVHGPGRAARLGERTQRDGRGLRVHRGRTRRRRSRSGPFRVAPFEMTHIGVRVARVPDRGRRRGLAYTGDTGPCGQAVELARGADLFLCEASYQNGQDLTFFHLSAAQAAEHAAKAVAGALVLTHIVPDARPAAVGRRGGRGVRRAASRSARREGASGDRRVTRPDGRATRRPPPRRVRARLPGVGGRIGLVLHGSHARAVRRVASRTTRRAG